MHPNTMPKPFSPVPTLDITYSRHVSLAAYACQALVVNDFYGSETLGINPNSLELGHAHDVYPCIADEPHSCVSPPYNNRSMLPGLEVPTYDAGLHKVSDNSFATLTLSGALYINPQLLVLSTSASTRQISPSYSSVSAPTTRIDACCSLSLGSAVSTERAISARVYSSGSPQAKTPVCLSRQGKTARGTTAKSKVVQFPRVAVLNALERRSLREHHAKEDPLWDGKLTCELCNRAYESKSLQRHLESHGRQSSRSAWVCCGVPDGNNGREHGCGFNFYHRRDALVRHIKQTSCLGDANEIQRHIRKAREEEREVFPGVW